MRGIHALLLFLKESMGHYEKEAASRSNGGTPAEGQQRSKELNHTLIKNLATT
jgi:hypothetical protein